MSENGTIQMTANEGDWQNKVERYFLERCLSMFNWNGVQSLNTDYIPRRNIFLCVLFIRSTTLKYNV